MARAGRPDRNYDHVEPTEVQAMLKEEQSLLSALGKYRDSINELRGKRDALVEKERPKHEKEIEKIERKIEAQMKKKDDAYNSMKGSNTTNHRDIQQRQKLFDHLKMAQLDIAPLERDVSRMQHDRSQLSKKVKQLTKEADKIKSTLQHKTHTDIEKALRNLEKKEERAREKQHTDVLKVLGQDRARLEGSKDRVTQYHEKMQLLMDDRLKLNDMDEKMQGKLTALEQMKSKLGELQAEKDKMMGTRDMEQTKEEREMEIEARKAKSDAQYEKVQDTKRAIDALYDEKRRVISDRASKEVKELDEEITKLIESRKKDGDRLDTVKKDIPSKTVAIEDSEVIGSLVGKQGATLRELEKDFGVIIDMKRAPQGVKVEDVIIRGGQCTECAEAVQAILEEAAASKFKMTVEFDKELTREFIGGGGKNIQLLQAQSEASINLPRDEKTGKTIDGKVIIVGKKENVEKAVQLVEEFKANNVRVVVEYTADMASVIRGPLMKQWQEEYNCRSIRAVQEARTITIIGKDTDVQRAQSEITSWLSESRSGKVEVRLGTVPPQVIIGRGGENVRAIQTETKTNISIDAGKVQIVGGKDGVARAKQMVEKLIQENTREEFKVDYKADLFNFLIRPRPWSDDGPAGKPLPGTELHKDPQGDMAERPPACLLEQIRVLCGVDRVRAMKEQNKVLIVGKTEPARRARERLRGALNFTDQTRVKVDVEGPILRHFTQRGGGPNVVDKLRGEPGITEILTSMPREQVQQAELIGTPEGTAAVKAKLAELVAAMADKIVRVDVDASKIRFVIGPGGATIRRIQEECGVTLNVDQAAEQVVIISENSEAAGKAKEEVERVISGGGDTRFSGN